MANIKADHRIRGIDRSEGAESFAHPHGCAVLNKVAHSEGKGSELEKHGCIKEFSHAGDDAMRGTALDPSDGGRANPEIERRSGGIAWSMAPNDRFEYTSR